MCYEWLYWKSKAQEAEKREQPQTVTERKPAAEQPKPAPATKQPEKVDTELEPV